MNNKNNETRGQILVKLVDILLEIKEEQETLEKEINQEKCNN